MIYFYGVFALVFIYVFAHLLEDLYLISLDRARRAVRVTFFRCFGWISFAAWDRKRRGGR